MLSGYARILSIHRSSDPQKRPQTCGPRWSQGRAPFHPILEAVGSLDTNPQAQSDYGTGVGLDLIIALVNEWWKFLLKNELLPSQRKNTKSEARIKIHHPIDPQLKCRLRCSLRCSLWPTSHAIGWTVLFTTAWNHQHFHFHVLRPACPQGQLAHLSRYRTKIKMKMHMVIQNSSEGHRDRMANFSSKILLRQNHQKSQWQLRQLACFFGVFSYAGGNTSQLLPGKAISRVYSSRVPFLLGMRSCVSSSLRTDCCKAAPRHLEVWTWDTHNPWS